MTKEEDNLKGLKKRYSELENKYELPNFEEVNSDFHIEKISEKETELLHWEIKRIIGEKLGNYMRFIENLLNPANVPMIIYSIVKVLSEEDKKTLSEVYKKLMKNEMKFIQSDLEASEKNDIGFVKDSLKLWKELRRDLIKVLGKVDKKWDETKIEPANKGYFG